MDFSWEIFPAIFCSASRVRLRAVIKPTKVKLHDKYEIWVYLQKVARNITEFTFTPIFVIVA